MLIRLMTGVFGSALVVAGLAPVSSFQTQPEPGRRGARVQPKMEMGHQGVSKAVCVLFRTGDAEKFDIVGTIHFEKAGDGKVLVKGEIKGLKPGKHGFHVHEFGDMSSMKDGSSAGSHFNPQGHSHGNQTDQQRHVGDLGNIEANDDGVAKIDIRDSMLALDGENSIIGRGLVVHFDEDKFTQPVGDAGGRFAIGVIGVAKK